MKYEMYTRPFPICKYAMVVWAESSPPEGYRGKAGFTAM